MNNDDYGMLLDIGRLNYELGEWSGIEGSKYAAQLEAAARAQGDEKEALFWQRAKERMREKPSERRWLITLGIIVVLLVVGIWFSWAKP